MLQRCKILGRKISFTLKYIEIRKHFLRYHSPPCASKSFCMFMCYHILHFGCVRSYANSTIVLPMPFGVQPFVTLAYHWYHWLSTGFTIGSIVCRRSRAWVKRFTRENYVIKMEDLKNLATETSGITAIFPIQMTNMK